MLLLPAGTLSGRPRKGPRLSGLVLLGTALALGGCGGEKAGTQAAPEVLVTAVLQQDVPIVSEWVGTLKGYVNAEIRAKVSGYIISQPYREGSAVRGGISSSRSIRSPFRPRSPRRRQASPRPGPCSARPRST